MARTDKGITVVDPLAEARKRVAQLTGTMMRVHALLGLDGCGQDEREQALCDWCGEREKEKRETTDGHG